MDLEITLDDGKEYLLKPAYTDPQGHIGYDGFLIEGRQWIAEPVLWVVFDIKALDQMTVYRNKKDAILHIYKIRGTPLLPQEAARVTNYSQWQNPLK